MESTISKFIQFFKSTLLKSTKKNHSQSTFFHLLFNRWNSYSVTNKIKKLIKGNKLKEFPWRFILGGNYSNKQEYEYTYKRPNDGEESVPECYLLLEKLKMATEPRIDLKKSFRLSSLNSMLV